MPHDNYQSHITIHYDIGDNSMASCRSNSIT